MGGAKGGRGIGGGVYERGGVDKGGIQGFGAWEGCGDGDRWVGEGSWRILGGGS